MKLFRLLSPSTVIMLAFYVAYIQGMLYYTGLPGVYNISAGNSWILPKDNYPVFYRHFRDRISWIEADAVCQFHHGQLAIADSDEQYDAVNEYLKDMDITDYVWIGLKRTGSSGPFLWNGKENLTAPEQRWKEKVFKSDNSLCVITDPAFDFKWKALECNGPASATFVCELDVPDWAKGNGICKVNTTGSIKMSFLPMQSAVQLSVDCGMEGTKQVTCNDEMDRAKIIAQATCSNMNNNTINESEIKNVSDATKKPTTNITILEKEIIPNYEYNTVPVNDIDIKTTVVTLMSTDNYVINSDESNDVSMPTVILPEEMSVAEEPIKSSIEIPPSAVNQKRNLDTFFKSSNMEDENTLTTRMDANVSLQNVSTINTTSSSATFITSYEPSTKLPAITVTSTVSEITANVSTQTESYIKIIDTKTSKIMTTVETTPFYYKNEEKTNQIHILEANDQINVTGYLDRNQTADTFLPSEGSHELFNTGKISLNESAEENEPTFSLVKKSLTQIQSPVQNRAKIEMDSNEHESEVTFPGDKTAYLESTLEVQQMEKTKPINVYKKIEIPPLHGGNKMAGKVDVPLSSTMAISGSSTTMGIFGITKEIVEKIKLNATAKTIQSNEEQVKMTKQFITMPPTKLMNATLVMVKKGNNATNFGTTGNPLSTTLQITNGPSTILMQFDKFQVVQQNVTMPTVTSSVFLNDSDPIVSDIDEELTVDKNSPLLSGNVDDIGTQENNRKRKFYGKRHNSYPYFLGRILG